METKFFESLYNFDLLVILTLETLNHHEQLNLLSHSPLSRDTMSMTYLRLCAMMEEMQVINSFCKHDSKLRAIMTHLKPFIDYVKQYEKGFSEMRNSAYAHFNRDKNGKFRPFWTTIDKINVPRSLGELRFICESLNYACLVLIVNYPDYKRFNENATRSYRKQIDVLRRNFVAKNPIDLAPMIIETNAKLRTDGLASPG